MEGVIHTHRHAHTHFISRPIGAREKYSRNVECEDGNSIRVYKQGHCPQQDRKFFFKQEIEVTRFV